MYVQAQDCVAKSEEQENLKSVLGKMLFPDIFKNKRPSTDACWPTRLLPHCHLVC